MSRLSKKVLERIRRENLHPEPKWHFLTEKILGVLTLFLLIIITILSAGLIIELISELSLLEFIYYPSDWHIIFSGLPYIWILTLALSLVLAATYFIKAFYGYRYRLRYIASIFIMLAFSFGFFIYSLGFSREIESYIEKKVPVYPQFTKIPETLWSQPEEGLLYGEIEEDPDCHCLKIKDEDDSAWELDDSDNSIKETMDSMDNLADRSVKIIGEKTGDNKFHIKKIITGRVKGASDERKDSKQDKSQKKSKEEKENNKNSNRVKNTNRSGNK